MKERAAWAAEMSPGGATVTGSPRDRSPATVTAMADVETVVYLPGIEGCRTVRLWRLRVDGGIDRVVTAGTLRDGRWWVAVNWEYPTGYGRVYGSETDAVDGAAALRDAHPGEWQETSVPAVTVRAG